MAQHTNRADATSSTPQQTSSTSYAGRFLKIAIIGILCLVAVHLLLQYLNLVIYGEQNGFMFELSNRWDLDDEISVPTWVSQVLLLVAGAFSFVVARIESTPARRALWYTLGSLGVLLSLDEGTSLHEFLLQSIHNVYFLNTSPTLSSNAWWLIAPLIVAVAGFLGWSIWKLLPRRTMTLLVIGGLSAIVGATVIDALASSIGGDPFFQQGILVGIEEGIELVGIATVIYAILDYAQTHHRTSLQRIIRALGGASS